MTDKLRDAAQQAIEALELTDNDAVYGLYRDERRQINDAIHTLRAALAEQTAEQEPVAYMLPRDGGDCAVFREPSSFATRYSPKGWIPLYTVPQPAAPTPPAQQDAQAVPRGWIPPSGLKVADIGFRWDGDALQHVPHVLVEFAPVPANLPNTEKGWADRDAFVEMLNAAPTPQAQRVMLTDDEINEVMHDYVNVENGLFKVHKALIKAYERKNGLRI